MGKWFDRRRRAARAVLRSPRAILERVLFWSGALGVVVLFADQLTRIGDFRIDDAYITFSFSKNLAAGNGPVYSHGLRVEGYSNFLWMLLVTPGFWLQPGGDGYLTARVLAFASLAFAAYLVYRLARRGAAPLTALLAPAAFLACSDVIRATLSGLETIPYAAAITFGWWAYLRESPSRRRWSLFAFLPAALMRIDGFVPFLIVIGFEGLSALVEQRFSLRSFARWAGMPIALWCAYFAWRYAYYGLPLPTTYYAKNMVDAMEPGRGIDQVWAFARDYGVVPLLPLMVLPAVRGRRSDGFALLTAVVLYLAYVSMTGGDWMPFQRFFLPVVPLAAVLAAWGAERVREELRSFPWFAKGLAGALVLGAFVFFGAHAHMGVVDTREEAGKLSEARHTKKHVLGNLLPGMPLARWAVRQPGERMVSDYAGVFAVFTDATIIDMWGLCNQQIALRGGIEGINPIFGKECASCYPELDPDYFHANVPLLRRANSFRSHSQVLDQIFQGAAISEYLDLRRDFVSGRVVETATGRAFWFIERRRPGRSFRAREPAPGIRVDYPFHRERD